MCWRLLMIPLDDVGHGRDFDGPLPASAGQAAPVLVIVEVKELQERLPVNRADGRRREDRAIASQDAIAGRDNLRRVPIIRVERLDISLTRKRWLDETRRAGSTVRPGSRSNACEFTPGGQSLVLGSPPWVPWPQAHTASSSKLLLAKNALLEACVIAEPFFAATII
jgi:hypothetical protein